MIYQTRNYKALDGMDFKSMPIFGKDLRIEKQINNNTNVT